MKGERSGDRGGASEPDLQEATDLLYSLSPSDFTSARNRLAKELKSRGRRDDARWVESLSKPVLSAWAVNQLARQHAPELQELVRITETASEAQDGGALKRAGRERRQTIAQLVSHAKRILEEGGHSATPTTLERISRTLQAASDHDQRDGLLEGRLSRDLEPGGLDFLAALSQTAVEQEPQTDRDEQALLEQELGRQIEEAEHRAARLTRAAEDAEKEARTLAGQAADARRELRRLKEEAAALRRRAR